MIVVWFAFEPEELSEATTMRASLPREDTFDETKKRFRKGPPLVPAEGPPNSANRSAGWFNIKKRNQASFVCSIKFMSRRGRVTFNFNQNVSYFWLLPNGRQRTSGALQIERSRSARERIS
ncbi:MAG: hypothetical protein ACTS6G_03745 [Candidatus Hodgkinia cicadicola]